jgi:hypothetical protein
LDVIAAQRGQPRQGGKEMSEDRDRLIKANDETEDNDVEAHKLKHNANEEPEAEDNDVEAHRLKHGQ